MNKREKEVIQLQLAQEKRTLHQLERQYKAALNTVNAQIAVLQAKEQTTSRQNRLAYQKQVQEQLEAVIAKLHGETYQTIEQFANDCYKTGYVGTMYDLHGQGVPVIVPIDNNAAVKAVMTDTKLKAGVYKELGHDMKTLKKKISNELTRGIASNMAYDDIARNIKLATGAPLGRAKAIVRTEGHRIQQASQEDARQVAKSKGADVVKQWDATLDGATRDSHRKLDGQIREVNEPFTIGTKKAMYPGEFGDPAEDCNCRCVALTRARAALDADELETLKERAKTFKLDKTKDFEDFKEKYLKAAEKVQEEEQKVKFVPAKTIEEAEQAISEFYNKNQFGAVGVSYKGVSVDVANEINSTLIPMYRTYDVPNMGGIIAPAGNTKLGQQMSGAIAGYSPIRKSFILNRKSLKNLATAQKAFEGEDAVFKELFEHPERFNFSKLSNSVVAMIERSRVSGRATVPRTVSEALQHEFGHALERKVFESDMWAEAERNMPQYADRISGYAGSSKGEYVAESFVSYQKGEGIVDPVLVQIFESLRRK